jgi:hypothetical protein
VAAAVAGQEHQLRVVGRGVGAAWLEPSADVSKRIGSVTVVGAAVSATDAATPLGTSAPQCTHVLPRAPCACRVRVREVVYLDAPPGHPRCR